MSGHTQGDPSTARRVMDTVPFGLWVTGAVSAIIVVTGMALTTVNRALSPVSSVIIAIVIALLLATCPLFAQSQAAPPIERQMSADEFKAAK